jgi:hypothetical protein
MTNEAFDDPLVVLERQAAISAMPSTKTMPSMSWPNFSMAVMRFQRFCASSANYNIIARALCLEKAPLTRLVRWRSVAKVDSIGLVVRMCNQCSAGKS